MRITRRDFNRLVVTGSLAAVFSGLNPEDTGRLAHALRKATARVLAAFMFADEYSVTAGELAERLGISSGSVSGAIKMLSTVELNERAPATGSRREHYRVRDGAWATLMSAQNGMVQAMFQAADRGIEAAAPDSPAARRLGEMRDFYGYMFRELPALVERWRTERGHPAPPR